MQQPSPILSYHSITSKAGSLIRPTYNFMNARKCFSKLDRSRHGIGEARMHNGIQHANPSDSWHALVHVYTKCELTLEEDKLVPVVGLTKEVQSRTAWRYLAGLWENNLLLDLLWYSPSEQHHDVGKATYRSPSWSSVRGDVLYVYESFTQSTNQGRACIQIIEVQVYLH